MQKKPVKIEELKKKYKNEWLAIEVTKEDKGISIEGRLLFHHREREKIWQNVDLNKGTKIYITYAGPPLGKEYAAAFTLSIKRLI